MPRAKKNQEKGTQLNARVAPELAKHLRIVLAADNLTYQEWLETRIRQYVERRRLSRTLMETPE